MVYQTSLIPISIFSFLRDRTLFTLYCGAWINIFYLYFSFGLRLPAQMLVNIVVKKTRSFTVQLRLILISLCRKFIRILRYNIVLCVCINNNINMAKEISFWMRSKMSYSSIKKFIFLGERNLDT